MKRKVQDFMTGKSFFYKLLVCAVLAVVLLAAAPPAYAAGMLTFDITNFLENILQYISNLMSESEQYIHTYQNARALYYQGLSVKGLDSYFSDRTIESVREELRVLNEIRNKVQGIKMQYMELEDAWDKTYKTRDQMSKLNNTDSAKNANNALDKTRDAISDAMKSQGLTERTSEDLQKLEELLAASSGSEGEHAAIQAGNQIAALQVVQLARLQQIIAQSERMKATQQASDIQRSYAGKAVMDKTFDARSTPNTLKGGRGAELSRFR